MFGVLCVLVGVGWWLGGSLPGVHVSLEKCQIVLALFVYTGYILRTSFTTPKGGKHVKQIERIYTDSICADSWRRHCGSYREIVRIS